MLIDWTNEFDAWYDRLITRSALGDLQAVLATDRVDAELGVLQDLQSRPELDSPTLRRVVQSGRHQVWRIAHPFVDAVAIRLIVWFPPDRPNEVVVVLFGADKAQMGDIFYSSVASRADAAIDRYLHDRRNEGERP